MTKVKTTKRGWRILKPDCQSRWFYVRRSPHFDDLNQNDAFDDGVYDPPPHWPYLEFKTRTAALKFLKLALLTRPDYNLRWYTPEEWIAREQKNWEEHWENAILLKSPEGKITKYRVFPTLLEYEDQTIHRYAYKGEKEEGW